MNGGGGGGGEKRQKKKKLPATRIIMMLGHAVYDMEMNIICVLVGRLGCGCRCECSDIFRICSTLMCFYFVVVVVVFAILVLDFFNICILVFFGRLLLSCCWCIFMCHIVPTSIVTFEY